MENKRFGTINYAIIDYLLNVDPTVEFKGPEKVSATGMVKKGWLEYKIVQVPMKIGDYEYFSEKKCLVPTPEGLKVYQDRQKLIDLVAGFTTEELYFAKHAISTTQRIKQRYKNHDDDDE